jgi:hypothetical protein
MEAMDLDADARVFGRPYFDKEYRKNEGPKIIDWLASIVHGRGEGAWKKDVLSPPPGYPLHSGDLSRDYGMGAMGVDEAARLALFEIRGARHRPYLVSTNNQLIHVARREYAEAVRYNPALAPAAPLAKGPEHRLLNLCDALYDDLRRLRHDASDVVSDPGNTEAAARWARMWKKCARGIEGLSGPMQAFGEIPCLAGVSAALGGIGEKLMPLGEPTSVPDVQRLAAWLPGYRIALSKLEQILWNAGSEIPIGSAGGGGP